MQAKIDWFRDHRKWEEAVTYIREILQRGDLHSKVRELCHFHLGDIFLAQGKIQKATDLLQQGIEDAGCRTTRIFTLLITIFGPKHYDNLEKEATYREMRKRAMKIEGFFE